MEQKKPIMTTNHFLLLLGDLFNKYGILHRDMIYQEELFEFQDNMVELLECFHRHNQAISTDAMMRFNVFNLEEVQS
jgi:hypothetical protein